MSWEIHNRPLIIAGPCSAESEEQLLRTCKALAEIPSVSMLRAGIWKPRTRPDSFEGMGDKALPWVEKTQSEVGLPCAIEVANAQHVEAALKHNITNLWIGARTTVSPFTVQEIADAVSGTNVRVLVKNPVSPDLSLWIGAIERIENAGVDKIAAIHRGFTFYGESIYRNVPNWEIPIELKRLRSDIPIICDPSHIGGRRDLIQSICQKALDINFDGLMIESHFDPDNALSDMAQQVTPTDLTNILSCMVIREDNNQTPEFNARLNELRGQIDQIDEEIFRKFLERMDIAKVIGEFKRESNTTILKLRRWEQIIANRVELAKEMGLSPDFVERVMQLVHKEAIRIQNQVMNSDKPFSQEEEGNKKS